MKKSSSILCIFLISMLAAVHAAAGVISFKCTVNKNDAIFKPGEKISFSAKMLEDEKDVSRPLFLRYSLFHDHKEIKKGTIKADSSLSLETSLNRPGWVFLHLSAVEEYQDGKSIKKRQISQEITKNGKKKVVKVYGGIGAMVSPEAITPSINEPEDFDEFWQNAKKELAAVPLKVKEIKQLDIKEVRAFDVKISCAGGKPVSGILCLPLNAAPGSAPAVLTFHGAGVRSAYPDIAYAKLGAITFNVNAHGIENGKPDQYYRDLHKNYYFTTLDEKRQNNYLRWNRDDRNKYYMRGMFLRVLRALEYVKTLPEWDGKHIAVTGTSQGGTQSIVAAALDKDVTFVRAGVPGWCDISGVLADRRSGGGKVYFLDEVRANPALAKETSYFDCMFFAKRIKCPIYMNTGFADVTCPPSSVFAAYNQLPQKTEKYMQTVPDRGHGAEHTSGKEALKKYIQKITQKGESK